MSALTECADIYYKAYGVFSTECNRDRDQTLNAFYSYIDGLNRETGATSEVELAYGKDVAGALVSWRYYGLQQVVISHKWGASLALTACSKAASLLVPMPWPTWMVKLPNGLITLPDGFSTKEISHVLVHQAQADLVAYLPSDGNIFLGATHRVALTEAETPGNDAKLSEGVPAIFLMIRRIVFGIALALHEHRESSGQKPPVRGAQIQPKIKGNSVVANTTTLTKDVRVNLQHVVRECCRDGVAQPRGPLQTQTWVMGHQKVQHYGQGRLQSKIITIEPYLRGPDNAPVAVRNHVVVSE